MRIFKSTFYLFATASTLACASLAYATNPPINLAQSIHPSSILQVSTLEHFKPRPSRMTKIRYDVWSQILEHFVIGVGPSVRIRTRSYNAGTGTRFKRGIGEPYRLETNKVLYPNIRSEVRDYISDYADELEMLGTQVDIPALERNQQLAYWINLHNAVIVREISKNYPGPKRRPRDITPIENSAEKLHSAKLINIDGVALSLNDIRQRIVYPNWKNPDVAFAFYLGDISSPSLRYEAYEATKLTGQLKENSEQYVNSLLGMEKGKVSRIYQDVAPWYFQNFESDLSAYLKKRMRKDVFAEYEKRGFKGFSPYQSFVSDITLGRGKGRISPAATNNLNSPGVQQFRKDARIKAIQLSKEDWFQRATVTIEDIETETGTEVE